MRNKYIILFLIMGMFLLSGAGCAKEGQKAVKVDNDPAQVRKNIEEAGKFLITSDKFKVSKLEDTGDMYYYAKDGKRYVFATRDAYSSWYGNSDPALTEGKSEMMNSPLGGQAGFKPGTLLITETDPKTYLVTGGGMISQINEKVLIEIWGANWKDSVIDLENWFFSAYNYGPVIDEIFQMPNISIQPDLEDNLIRP